MSSTPTLSPLDEVETTDGTDDMLCHLSCCRPNVALCGFYDDNPEVIYGPIDDKDCPECVALSNQPCPVCGLTAVWE